MEEQRLYVIIVADTVNELETEVNTKMEEGYIPIGGPFRGGDYPLNQAMILNGTQKVITLP